MKANKIIIFLTCLALAASLTGCSNPTNDTAREEEAEKESKNGETEEAAENSSSAASDREDTDKIGVDETMDAATDVNNFADKAQDYLEYIGTELTDRSVTGTDEKVSGDNDHAATVNWIISELEDAGYSDDQITSDTEEMEGFPIQNIVLTVEGKDPSGQIIVGAHYDGDGIGDNGSGTALLLSTAVCLKETDQQPLYTVKYIFFDAEEVGSYGALTYAESMTDEEISATCYMVNIDSIGFGDYCNVYGGCQDEETGEVTQTEGYELAMDKAEALGLKTMRTEDLDGYYEANGDGPEIEANTLYTNPWTSENPAPQNGYYNSPSTGDWSDHEFFEELGIPYIYMEATNWYAKGDGGEDACTGYFDTGYEELGESGMFMNTEFDTLENLETYFPGRTINHFNVFSPLLSSLILNPESDAPEAD